MDELFICSVIRLGADEYSSETVGKRRRRPLDAPTAPQTVNLHVLFATNRLRNHDSINYLSSGAVAQWLGLQTLNIENQGSNPVLWSKTHGKFVHPRLLQFTHV